MKGKCIAIFATKYGLIKCACSSEQELLTNKYKSVCKKQNIFTFL